MVDNQRNRAVAFLDLLGFTWLLKNNRVTAIDNLNSFNEIIKTKIADNDNHPAESYTVGMQESVRNGTLTSLEYMISISDSLIISSQDSDQFVKQLCDFVIHAFIDYSEPFVKPIEDIFSVNSNKVCDVINRGDSYESIPHKAFPILFRGGISYGSEVEFDEKPQIKNYHYNKNALNVAGMTYVEAVSLEKSGKGPRLFCNKKFVDSLSLEGRKAIRQVVDGLYEIVWTYYACEVTDCSIYHKMDNVRTRVREKLLVRAINLYNYFLKEHDGNKQENEQEYCHYKEFIILIYRGIIKYAQDNDLDISQVKNIIDHELRGVDIVIPDEDSWVS